MAFRSFLDCKHQNIQQFTECCLDCGYNIYTTETEYLEDLRRKVGKTALTDEIRELERTLAGPDGRREEAAK